jgi:hypothetical protein
VLVEYMGGDLGVISSSYWGEGQQVVQDIVTLSSNVKGG